MNKNNPYTNKKYIAIIGDIIQSKSITNRLSVQSDLENTLLCVNNKYESRISSDFKITLGDEFQGLLFSPLDLMSIIEEIQYKMNPVLIRFGIGIGAIDTKVIRESPFGMDGSAYHHAREGIITIKSNEKKRMNLKSDIYIKTENAEFDSLINTIFALTYTIKKRWTDAQKEAIYKYVSCGLNQEKAAKSLGITQPGINKRLNSADYYTYANAIKNVNSALEEYNNRTLEECSREE